MAEPDDDSRIILSIFNYCDRRCERCTFTERCTLFKDLRKYEHQHPNRGPFEQARDRFQDVFRLLEQWCEREGIDFDELRRQAHSDQSVGTIEGRDASVRADPLQKIATTYTHAALKLVDALAAARALRAWPPDVAEAIDTIAWHAGLVSSKTYRALIGFAERGGLPEEDDLGQSDWNGSAKVVRLIIAESKDAWFKVMRAGGAADDSPLTELVSLLERLDAGLAERFPRAMEFIRPGFDEPWRAGSFVT